MFSSTRWNASPSRSSAKSSAVSLSNISAKKSCLTRPVIFRAFLLRRRPPQHGLALPVLALERRHQRVLVCLVRRENEHPERRRRDVAVLLDRRTEPRDRPRLAFRV